MDLAIKMIRIAIIKETSLIIYLNK